MNKQPKIENPPVMTAEQVAKLLATACEDLLAENARLRGLIEWQDISTAPKDGKHFLAFIPWGEGIEECAFVCSYSKHYGRIVLVLAPETRFEPTKWLPLPPAPANPNA